MSEQSEDRGDYALAECRAYDSPLSVTRALNELAKNFPVVAPGGTTECTMIPEGYGVSITAVIPGADDVYKDSGSGQTCFKAAFLKKLAAGVGIEWIPSETRRLDNFAHPFVCSIVVAGRYRDWSGDWRTISASHMLDLRDDAAHGMKDKPKQLEMARKNIAQLCETKAKSRAIADACVSRTIDPRDLDRPIPMAKLYRRDPADGQSGNRAASALYGGDGIESARPADVDEVTGEVQHGNPGRGPSSAPHAPAAAPTGNGGASSGVTAPSPSTASRAAPAAEAKPHLIPKGYKGEGKTFAAATDDELAEYAMSLGARIASGEIPAPGAPAAKAKLAAAEAEIARRESLNNEAAW